MVDYETLTVCDTACKWNACKLTEDIFTLLSLHPVGSIGCVWQRKAHKIYFKVVGEQGQNPIFLGCTELPKHCTESVNLILDSWAVKRFCKVKEDKEKSSEFVFNMLSLLSKHVSLLASSLRFMSCYCVFQEMHWSYSLQNCIPTTSQCVFIIYLLNYLFVYFFSTMSMSVHLCRSWLRLWWLDSVQSSAVTDCLCRPHLKCYWVIFSVNWWD